MFEIYSRYNVLLTCCFTVGWLDRSQGVMIGFEALTRIMLRKPTGRLLLFPGEKLWPVAEVKSLMSAARMNSIKKGPLSKAFL